MKAKSLTGTAILLAIAFIVQQLRILFPFIPNMVSQYIIGTIVAATIVLATKRYGLGRAGLIAWATPIVAYLQGMLPLLPMILVIGCGSTAYALLVRLLHTSSYVYILAPLVKATVMYLGTLWVIYLFHLPTPVTHVLTFMMSWPQVITGVLGIVLANIIEKRIG